MTQRAQISEISAASGPIKASQSELLAAISASQIGRIYRPAGPGHAGDHLGRDVQFGKLDQWPSVRRAMHNPLLMVAKTSLAGPDH